VDRLCLSLAAAPLVFAACAFATRAPARRMVAALAGGAAFTAGNAAWDLLAHAAGWWSYPGVGARDWRVASASDAVIVFAPGPLPWLADGAAAFTLMALALALQLALGGDPRSLR
jgi:hypothetical protein